MWRFQRWLSSLWSLDRASKDNTLALLRDYAVSEPRLKPVFAPENRCVVDAYVRGYREAIASGADWVMEIDAGFSHRPSDLPPFFAAMAQGVTIVFSLHDSLWAARSKAVRSSGRWSAKAAQFLANLLLRTKLSDMTSGFQLFKREVLASILEKGIFSRGPFFQTEMKAYCQSLNYVEVPITYSMASHSVGAGSIKESLQQLWRLYRLKRAGTLSL